MKKLGFFVLCFIVALSTAFIFNDVQEKEAERTAKNLNVRALSFPPDVEDDPEKRNAPSTKKRVKGTRSKRVLTTLILLVVVSAVFCSNVYGFEFREPISVYKNTVQYRSGIDFVDEDEIYRLNILPEAEYGYFRFETKGCDMNSYIVDIFQIPTDLDFFNTSSIIDTLPKICTLDGGCCYTKLPSGKFYAVLRQIKATEYNPVYAVVTAVSALKR